MDWNDERIATLTQLWREGYSAAQVARRLGGVSRSAVIGKVHRLGIAGRAAPSRPSALAARPNLSRSASSGGVARPVTVRAPQTPATPAASFEVAPTATIHTLREGGCRWPIGEPGEPGFGFCGRIRTGAGSYCSGHAPMAVRRREAPLRTKDIDHLVRRFAEGGAFRRQPEDFSWREIA